MRASLIPILSTAMILSLSSVGWAKPTIGTHHVVEFPHGSTAHVVASPTSKLERRLLERLSTSLQRVLGKPPTIVDSLAAVPVSETLLDEMAAVYHGA